MIDASRTGLVKANGLSFEVTMQGIGDKLALCLHGFPEHAHSWRYQMPLLASLGYEVWAPNLRGYGRSSRPDRVADYALEHLLSDVAGLIDAAGNRPTTLIAHDWVNAKQRAKSWYVLFFQIPLLPERLLARDAGRFIARMIRDTSAHPARFSESDLAIFAANAATPSAVAAMLNYYRALVVGGGAKRQARLGSPVIATPTLLLWGEDDMALDKACTYGTEAFVRPLTVRYLPGVSHWAQQDDPDTVNAMLQAFLADAPVPHATGTDALSGDIG